jgi:hypothetical protein
MYSGFHDTEGLAHYSMDILQLDTLCQSMCTMTVI